MGVNDLQTFLESSSLDRGAVSVDLLKIARNVTQRQQPHNTNRKIRPIGNKLKLIVDAENCLDRLYGGYFSDWACGGQWNRMVQFLSLLTRAIERGNIELAVVFNGTIEQCRMDEWVAEQANIRQKVGMVLKHINTKATPPPKIWWTAPTCLRSALRMALRHLGVTVMCTMDDHHQEVIAYCREYGFHGLLADDAEYAAFDPPRYFSSENLKLTYKGSIETKEYMISELTKSLKITQEQVCIMSALLGNFLLPETELQDLYKKLNMAVVTPENGPESNIKSLSEFVRTLPPPSDMDALVLAVFDSLNDKRASKFRQSVQYYLNGTASGFLKYCAPAVNAKDKNKKLAATVAVGQASEPADKVASSPIADDCNNTNNKADEQDLDPSGFASETTEQEQESLQNYKNVTAISVLSDFEGLEGNMKNSHNGDSSNFSSDTSRFNGVSNGSLLVPQAAGSSKNQISSNSSDSSSQSSPKAALSLSRNANSNLVTPSVSPDVLRTASLRHQKGLMAPMILHVLSTQEVRLPCLMEDEANREVPPIHEIFRNLRQHVYAVLFNLHHLRYVHSKKKENNEVSENCPQPDIIVKEWVYTRANPFQKPVEIKAEALPWAVPTLQRLWFGPSVDDKRRRMRALLSCLNSDTPLILNTDHVPHHMLMMACVLRYIMSQDMPILRRNELDAFLCHAFNPNLMNPQYLQELTLTMVTSRGVQLAALFMEGVDMALLANDACGAPLPWLMCCPWLYFDGKLFHFTLNRSTQAKNILELCENYIDRVVKVERMRKAILEGLEVKFAKVPMTAFPGGLLRQGIPPPHCLPSVPLPSSRGAAALRQRPIPARGGQLQVAGVVVGSWGANYGYRQQQHQQPPHPHPHHPHHHHQGMVPAGYNPNVGGRGGGGRGVPHAGGAFGRYDNNGRGGGRGGGRGKPGGGGGLPTFNVGNRKNTANKKRNTNKNNKTNQRGFALTVKTDNGDIPVSDVVLREDGTFVGAKTESETTKTNSAAAEQHKGQGDAPAATASN